MNKVDGVDLCCLSSVQGMHSLAAAVETSTAHWRNWGKPVDTDTDSGWILVANSTKETPLSAT